MITTAIKQLNRIYGEGFCKENPNLVIEYSKSLAISQLANKLEKIDLISSQAQVKLTEAIESIPNVLESINNTLRK